MFDKIWKAAKAAHGVIKGAVSAGRDSISERAPAVISTLFFGVLLDALALPKNGLSRVLIGMAMMIAFT